MPLHKVVQEFVLVAVSVTAAHDWVRVCMKQWNYDDAHVYIYLACN